MQAYPYAKNWALNHIHCSVMTLQTVSDRLMVMWQYVISNFLLTASELRPCDSTSTMKSYLSSTCAQCSSIRHSSNCIVEGMKTSTGVIHWESYRHLLGRVSTRISTNTLLLELSSIDKHFWYTVSFPFEWSSFWYSPLILRSAFQANRKYV